ncbi:MAG: RagB/SusD family nutrient uptake outer membrane protein, partial [Dysgonamonadaceae bacterium]|nr:RagB/SusD family nutrient uptake outer membrane protein [Dysgonamonadaceae bacterium]
FKNYEKAKEWFEKAMQAAPCELTENYAWNFDFNHENNSESIFEVQFQATSSYSDLASYMWRRLGPDGKGFGMVNVSLDWVNKFSVGYELTQEVYDEVTGQTIFGAPDLVLIEVMKAYQGAIGVSVFSPEEFFALYTGDWNALGDQINAALRAAKYRLDVKKEPGWGTVNSTYVQAILNRSRAADPRMYDSFYVPGRDSISLDWAGIQVKPYPNAYYGFKKYIPYNAVESWASEGLPYTDGFNSINQRIFRLADLYLQYAEACYRTSDMNNAKKYLNKVRRRAWGLPFDDPSLTSPETVDFPTSEDDPADFMKAIIAEREKEFCLEGHLWFDYLRWNKAEELFKNRGFNPEIHHRLPIPLSERQIVGMNVLLQNKGY